MCVWCGGHSVCRVKGQEMAGVCYAYTLPASAAAGRQEAASQVSVAAGSAVFL